MICPKCGNKISKEQIECPYCQTKVKNIEQASNKKAKEIMKLRDDTSKIVMSRTLPADVSKIKLLLLCIFLGWTGAHCYYVGRHKRGFTIALLLLCSMLFVAIPSTWAIHALFGGVLAGFPGMIAFFCWWLDICRIIGNRFQVPVVLNNY